MNVRCHACKTVYRIDPTKVPSGGVRARCTTCPEIIDVPAPGPTARTALADARAPAASVPTRPSEPVFRPAAAPTAEARPAPQSAAAPAPPGPKAPKIKVSRPISGAAITTPPPAETEPRKPARPFTLEKPTLDAGRAPAAAPERPMAPVFKPSGGRRLAAPPVPPAIDEVLPPAGPAQPMTAPPAEPPLEFPTAKPVAPAPPAKPASPAKRAPINPFLTRDPRQKARRLARALVSDMIVYQPEKRQQALAAGNLKEAFDEEIKKSWDEYVEQVGEELANSTPYFTEALNDILAGGQELF
ncbi:MAG: zinc-ribbon domain-containing protein [Gemmatimonadota bacterium]|nr:zinc-ribbon domain-containing protein [Gemmatimonadota bacterium]MDH3477093.1 zinc-ribbon domain-containing protein [Gemmatimonadota bacterium]MDH3568778.1 zinc-ribbon domain-containing protein [Gemmatimonadota bacterium]MDH5550791.1 zinc-ribbon domain-containing protein [Gemmatimonadota bacterium]